VAFGILAAMAAFARLPPALLCLAALTACTEAEIRITADRPRAVDSLSGFLKGFTPAFPPAGRVEPLAPRLLRIGHLDPATQAQAAALGARVQLVLSDGYGYGTRPWPWQDPAGWQDYVRATARAAQGAPLIWDIWNEPDLDHFWPGDEAQAFEAFRQAHDILRAELGPAVQIAGPSLMTFDAPALERFLTFCAKTGLRVDVLSWHELNVRTLPGLAGRLRAAARLAARPDFAAVGVRDVQIGEYLGPLTQNRPGEVVAYLAAMEEGGANAAARACWPEEGGENCAALDGLVTPDGRPRPVWWVYKAYAEAVEGRVDARADHPGLAVLAGRRGDSVQALIGHVGGLDDTRAPIGLRLTLAPSGPGCLRVEHSILGAGSAPLDPPPLATHTQPAGAPVRLGDLPAHAAALVTLTPVPCPP